MADDSLSATTAIDAPADVIFAVLADPVRHAEIDGTGRVRGAVDTGPLIATGQLFRMSMYHENHPDGIYQMTNRVLVFDPPRAISWEPGNAAADGVVSFPGWTWRYDLRPTGPSSTTVTLSYDWSAVPYSVREHIGFPPFPREHLRHSLANLAELTTS